MTTTLPFVRSNTLPLGPGYLARVKDGCSVSVKLPDGSKTVLTVPRCMACPCPSGCRYDEGRQGVLARMELTAWANAQVKGKAEVNRTNEEPDPELVAEAKRLFLAGTKVRDIGERLGCSSRTAYRWLRWDGQGRLADA